MTHLSEGELVNWRDRPTDADRAHIVGHLAVCETCAARYAEMVRTTPVDDLAAPADLAALAARGHEIGRRALDSGSLQRAAPRRPMAWRWPALAAAAVVLLAVLVPWRSGIDEPPVTRGSAGLVAGTPTGAVTAQEARTFRWSSADAAGPFRFELLDPADAVVYDTRVTGSLEVTLPPDVLAALVEGREFRWLVSRLDARGQVLETSAATRFTIRR